MKNRSVCSVLVAVAAILLGVPLSGYGGAKTSHEAVSPSGPTAKPDRIYVADFDIGSADIKQEEGIAGRSGPLGGRVLRKPDLLNRQPDPASTAAMLVDVLATSLTRELTEQALPAVRLAAGRERPKTGWLIAGRFLEVDAGQRVRRAVIGFGAGASEMELEVEVFDLAGAPESPFLVMGTHADSGRMPGAVVTLNPYVAAAKFVLAKNASEKDVKHAASEIARELVGYMKGNRLLPP